MEHLNYWGTKEGTSTQHRKCNTCTICAFLSNLQPALVPQPQDVTEGDPDDYFKSLCSDSETDQFSSRDDDD